MVLLISGVSEEPGLIPGQLEPGLQDDVQTLLVKLLRRLHRNKNVRLLEIRTGDLGLGRVLNLRLSKIESLNKTLSRNSRRDR